MGRLLAFLLLLVLATGCAAKAPGQCAAWGCHEPASAPLAWTRPDGGAQATSILSSGDLCARHAEKTPFVFVARFVVFFAVFPALLLTWVSFRLLYIVDQHGPGLPKFTGGNEARARALLFGAPTALGLAWLAFFAVRALA